MWIELYYKFCVITYMGLKVKHWVSYSTLWTPFVMAKTNVGLAKMPKSQDQLTHNLEERKA